MGENGPTEQAAYERELKRKDRELELKKRELVQKDHNDKMMFRVTVISVIVAFFTAGVAYYAAKDTSEGSRKGLELQGRAVDAQILAMQTEQRPFVSFSAFNPEYEGRRLKPNEAPRLSSPYIAASGKTPAYNITFKCYVFQDPPSSTWTEIEKKVHPMWLTYMLPSRTQTIECSGDKDIVIGRSPDSMQYVGVISYEDRAHHHFQTPFCEFVTGDLFEGKWASRLYECEGDPYKLPELQ